VFPKRRFRSVAHPGRVAATSHCFHGVTAVCARIRPSYSIQFGLHHG
jgi:hypothetical protein